MVIVFANQKGGVGKTTLALAYANYLSEHDKRVLLIDLDTQQSCTYRRAADNQNWDPSAIRYNIEGFSIKTKEEGEELMNKLHYLSQTDGCIVLIDVPGNVTDDYLAPLFVYADVIICPFIFQNMVLDSTSTFIKVLEALENKCDFMDVKKIFIPNMVEKSVGTINELKSYKAAEEIISNYGLVAPRVYKRAEISRIDTIVLTAKQHNEFEKCFAFIDSNIF